MEIKNYNGISYPLISIIIPVYNNKMDEIERCINSILRQSFQSYEIIIIDDGSTSDLADYLDSFSSNKLIHVFHQENKGVSFARNYGISVARGNYVAFVDADDIVSRSFLEQVGTLLEEYGCSVDVFYGFVKCVKPQELIFSNESEVGPYFQSKKLDYTLRKRLYQHMIDLSSDEFKGYRQYVSRGPYARVVKRRLAIECPFDQTLTLGEDSIWNLTILKHEPSCVLCYSTWYYYVFNSDSATHTFSQFYLQEIEKFLVVLQNFIINEQTKVNYLRKTIELLAQLNNVKESPSLSIQNHTSTYKMMQSSPWNYAFKWEYGKQLKRKNFVKFILIKIRFYDFIIKILKKSKQIFTEK